MCTCVQPILNMNLDDRVRMCTACLSQALKPAGWARGELLKGCGQLFGRLPGSSLHFTDVEAASKWRSMTSIRVGDEMEQ